MTEAGYRSWVRSQLRKISMRWKPIYEAKALAKRPVEPTDRLRWGNLIKYVYVCALCADRVPDKHGAVDHIEPCGTLVDIEKDAGPFILRMLCESDKLRFLCDPCHNNITKDQRENPTS